MFAIHFGRSSNLAPPPKDRDEKVSKADRERYLKQLVLLRTKLADTISPGAAAFDDDAVWDVYSGVEMLIAVLKFRLDYETPGVFTKLPDAKDPRRLLEEARALLSHSEGEISGLRLEDAVETLRKARNNLRSILAANRRAATRADRPARSRAAAP
jgi:hypothetical protein